MLTLKLIYNLKKTSFQIIITRLKMIYQNDQWLTENKSSAWTIPRTISFRTFHSYHYYMLHLESLKRTALPLLLIDKCHTHRCLKTFATIVKLFITFFNITNGENMRLKRRWRKWFEEKNMKPTDVKKEKCVITRTVGSTIASLQHEMHDSSSNITATLNAWT